MEKYLNALNKINDIRNSIIGYQAINWSAHIYPLVAALDEAGIEGLGWEKARELAKTQVERIKDLESTVKRLQEENEQLNQWKREEIAVWGPLHDYFLTEDKLINLGESIAAEALHRSKQYVRLLVVLKAIMNEYDSKGQLLGFNVNIVREALKSELNK